MEPLNRLPPRSSAVSSARSASSAGRVPAIPPDRVSPVTRSAEVRELTATVTPGQALTSPAPQDRRGCPAARPALSGLASQ